MGSVWIVLFVCGLCVVAWIVGKGERKAPPAPPPEYPARRRGWWPRLRGKAEDKGLFAERLLVERLKDELDPVRFAVMHDVWLRVQRGGTTQIDCMVVCPACVFAVEVKARNCEVWGRPGERWWTLKYSRTKKVPMKNPQLQNQGHIADLRENFASPREWDVRSIVAFTDGSRFMRPMPDYVLHFSEVAGYIERVASQERRDPLDLNVAAVVAAIRRVSDGVSQQERDAHVDNLHERWERTRNL